MDVLFYICGVIMGVAITLILAKLTRAGTLVVYVPNTDDSPYLTLELDQSVGQISKKKYTTVKIDVRPLNTRQ